MKISKAIDTVIGKERTLVITCLECFLDIDKRGEQSVFRYTALGTILNLEDPSVRETILGFIEFEKCSRIIIVGHYGCLAIDYLLKPKSPDSLSYRTSNIMRTLNHDYQGNLVCREIRNRLLVDVNVIRQCEALKEIPEIQNTTYGRCVNITGLVVETNGSFREVYSNGMIYNDLVSLN